MAMIGRNAAVAEVGKHRHQVEGPLAFAAWLGVHAMLLSGAHSRTDAFLTWAWDYFDRDHAATVEASVDAAAHRLGRRRRRRPAHLARPAGPDDARPAHLRRTHMTDDYDVIIVGSGAGGGTLAHRLAPSGKRVLILERGDWLPREVENWDAEAVFVDNRYVSADTWFDERGQGVPAPDPLLRRRRDEVLRRRAVPAARARLRRAQAPRRHLAGLADRLRRARAVLHAGRAAVPGARRPRRGPDRAAGVGAVPLSRRSRTSRASSSSSTTWPRSGCTRSTPRPASCSTRRTRRSAPASAAPPATASRAWCTPSPTPT